MALYRARISAPARVTSWLGCPDQGISAHAGRFSDALLYWPEDTDFALWELDVLDRNCPVCGRMMHICDHRYRRFHTLDGPVQLICKLNHCPDPACPGHAKTKSPELEITLALPQMAIGWDVFCWIGHRRCSRHMAISLIQSELLDDYAIKLSEDAIEQYIRRYQVMLAARQQDAESLRRQYESVAEIILCIDGLQPEKGHETLYVVRELTQKRVWFAEPLLSATEDEVRRLITEGQRVGRILGQACGALDVGQAGCVRQGDRGGIPRRAAPLLRQPLPPRRGQARPGGRQPCQGSDAEEGARPAEDRTSRAPAAEGRDQGRPHARRSGSHRHGDRGGEPVSCRGRSRRRCGARLLRGGAWDPQ